MTKITEKSQRSHKAEKKMIEYFILVNLYDDLVKKVHDLGNREDELRLQGNNPAMMEWCMQQWHIATDECSRIDKKRSSLNHAFDGVNVFSPNKKLNRMLEKCEKIAKNHTMFFKSLNHKSLKATSLPARNISIKLE